MSRLDSDMEHIINTRVEERLKSFCIECEGLKQVEEALKEEIDYLEFRESNNINLPGLKRAMELMKGLWK